MTSTSVRKESSAIPILICAVVFMVRLTSADDSMASNLSSVAWLSWMHKNAAQNTYSVWGNATTSAEMHCNNDARDVLARAMAISSRSLNRSATRHAAEALVQCGQWKEAIEQLDKYQNDCQTDVLARYLGGALAFKLKRFEQAATQWTCAGFQGSLLSVANHYINAGKWADAAGMFKLLIEIDPANSGAMIGLGNVLASDGHWESALPYFERALAKAPNDSRIVSSYGIALSNSGVNDELALEMLLRAITLQPDNVWLYGNLADYYERRSVRSQAETVLSHAAQTFPTSYIPPMLLGSIYLQRNDLPNAIELLKNAYALHDPSGQTAGALGEAYRRSNSDVLAVPYLREAVKQFPDSLIYRYELAFSYAKLGQCVEARAQIMAIHTAWNYDASSWSEFDKQTSKLCFSN
jgi:tetratricopeptide (TPR) repeat protein